MTRYRETRVEEPKVDPTSTLRSIKDAETGEVLASITFAEWENHPGMWSWCILLWGPADNGTKTAHTSVHLNSYTKEPKIVDLTNGEDVYTSPDFRGRRDV